MQISIITPSFRNSNWLKLCIASVADQTGVSVEHIVQDAGSDDGTLDWLTQDKRVQAYVEKDGGMYDAINRGLRKARGEILAYLNCDEQYLPGALKMVHDYFVAHPTVEVVFGDTVVVNEQGEFICYRKVVLPSRLHVLTCHLPTFSCAMFFRRRVLEKDDCFFDTRWRMVGDAAWVVRLLELGAPMGLLRQFTSAFTVTDDNMGYTPTARAESQAFRRLAPRWAQIARPAFVSHHRLRKLLGGCYRQRPFRYAIYTGGQMEPRQTISVEQPRFRMETSR